MYKKEEKERKNKIPAFPHAALKTCHTHTLLSHDPYFARGRQLGGPENKTGGK